jgi:hypothetical protein
VAGRVAADVLVSVERVELEAETGEARDEVCGDRIECAADSLARAWLWS